MIKLIYGLPGVGKTASIRQSIKSDIENGKKVILIAPEQQAVELERDMLKVLPSSAQLSFETVNFTRLANKLFRIYGGLSYNYISKGLKALFMKRTLIELAPMLKEYVTRAEGDSSLPDLMLEQINEFKVHGVNPVMLEGASKKLDDSHPLKSKLIDLSLIYSVYEGMVKNAYDDSADDLEKLYEILKENNFFNGYSVYIDSFSSFTAWQYKIINRIFMQADNCTVTIPSPSPSSTDVYLKSVNEMSNKLRSYAGDDVEIVILSENHRAKNESLKRISNYLWDFKTSASSLPYIKDDESVEIIECVDQYAESEAVANVISRLVMDGYRRREIAVIAGNMDSYSGIIDSALEKARIPFYFSEKTELSSKPVTAFLLSAFAIKLRNWRREDVMAHLKTGLSDISISEVDNFEIYTSTWDIKGNRFFDEFWSMNPDGYSTYLSKRGEKILNAANAVKNKLVPPLSAFFTRLDSSKTVSELCSVTYDFIVSSGIPEKLKKRAKSAYLLGNRRDAMEASGTLKVLIKTLRDISSAFGDEEMTLEEFVSSFKTVLSNSDIGTIPTAADEVLLGSASMLRAEGIRAAILIGVNDGVFPAKISDTGFFSSGEKELLKELGIELSGNTSERSAEELLYAYRAMTLPSEKLILIYYTNSLSGGISKQSIAVDRVASLIHDDFKVKKYALMGADSKLMSKDLSFESFKSLPESEFKSSLKALLLEDEKYAKKLDKTSTPISDTTCRLKKETANKIFGNKISTTHSRLEAYMNCHFAYYATNILDIRSNEKARFNNNHAGTFIHRIFEVFIKATVDENGFNQNISKDEIKSIVINEAKAYTDEMFKNERNPSPRIAHYISYLIKLAEVTAEALYDELLDSLFVPKYFEFRIGNSEKDALPSPEITLDDGTKVYLRGTVDRVDVYKKDGDVYLKVIDYKTGNIEFNIDKIKEGGNIQLLLYLFAICNSKSQKVKSLFDLGDGNKLIPASATYISNKIKKVSAEFSGDSTDVYNKVKNEISYRGVVLKDPEILNALSKSGNKKLLLQPKYQMEHADFLEMENTIEELIKTVSTEMKEGNADIDPKKGKNSPCKYCKLKQFCRIKLDQEYENYEETEDEE